jgi:hypothetical protein
MTVERDKTAAPEIPPLPYNSGDDFYLVFLSRFPTDRTRSVGTQK